MSSPVEAQPPDPPAGNGKRARRGWRERRDWAGLLARVLCGIFALIGLVPLALGGLARFDRFQDWAAERTSKLLADQLKVEATYDLELQPWPLQLEMSNVVIAASDGGSPFLEARSVVARPRIFSLLAGKPDLGAVEIEDARVRAVIAGGDIVNLRYELPEGDSSSSDRLPLSAIALTNGQVDVTVDDIRVQADEIDVDVTFGRMPGDKKPIVKPAGLVEVSLRAGKTTIDRRHEAPEAPELDMLDEDILCSVDVRASVGDNVLVRRLELHGALDFDPGVDTRPPCELAEDDWRQLALSLEGGEVRLTPDGDLDTIDGRLKLRAPVSVVHRFIDIAPTTGWVGLDLERAHWDKNLKLPNAKGKLSAGKLSIDSKFISHYVRGDLNVDNDVITIDALAAGWAGGDAKFERVVVEPFAKGAPLEATGIAIANLTIEDLLDDINVHPRSHVGWSLETTTFEKFGGTIDPLNLQGMLVSDTRDFGIYDKPSTDPNKKPFMQIDKGVVSGNFRVTKDAIVLGNFAVNTGRSNLRATVSLGYEEHLGLAVHEGSKVDLRDVSPLAKIPMEGRATVSLEGGGNFDDPHFTAQMDVDNFVFGGFPIGDVHHSKVEFVPLSLRFSEGMVSKGDSKVDVGLLNVDFDNGDADVVVDGHLDTRVAGMHLQDFFRMVNLLPAEPRREGAVPASDPSWESIDGEAFGSAQIHYVLGGRRDPCDSGNLKVRARMAMADVDLWDVHYDRGNVDVSWHWKDIEAGDQGLEIDVHSGVMRKGTGTIVTNASIRRGARIRADVVATSIPLNELKLFRDAFGVDRAERDDTALRRVRPEANVSFVMGIGGTLGALQGHADVDVSSMRIGPDLLPPSRLTMKIVPKDRPPKRAIRYTKCNNKVTPPFNPAEWKADNSDGHFQLAGSMFGGQIRFDDIQITQQRSKMVSGGLKLRGLDLGALANLMPGVAFSAKAPRGNLSADVFIDELPIDEPGVAEVRMLVKEADIKRGDTRLHIGEVDEPVVLSGDALRIPTMPIGIRVGTGLGGTLVGGGTISRLSSKPVLSLSTELEPIDLSRLGVEIPQIKRAAGIVRAKLDVNGPLDAPQLGGRLVLDDGMLRIKGVPLPLDDLDVDVRVRGGEVSIRRATARVGNTGRVALNGRLPLSGVDIQGADATLVATDVKVPVADGVKLTADARLRITYSAHNDDNGSANLPNVTGRVTLKNFSYTRPMSFRLDLDQLTGGGRTEVDTYKPENDTVNFDVSLVSPQPVRIANNLLDMRFDITPPGIRLSGTDQRFGARGQLRIAQGSKLFLRGHDFEVSAGKVEFDDPTRIAPKMDVNATTEYRRYAANASQDAAATTTTETAAGSATGGRWRIGMHAYGDIEAPEVKFTSDPPLSQEDIVLLLSVGQTRAELDRNLSGALAQTVGFEALNAVTGLDQALRQTVPIIDEFRVGSQYSSRTGRPEPSVTLGKRISDDVRATITTGLSEDREVRSNIEWRLKGGVSVQGSYDNVNDVSSSILGNVGAGLRWRLEFE